jgi:hypothetical protein
MAHAKHKSAGDLSSILPDGLVVDRKWLKDKGIDRPLVDYYIRAGKLESLARGAYRRPGPPLKWQHLVYSCQQLNYPVHVCCRTAAELQGMAHYLPLGEKQTVHLYCRKPLPHWLFSATIDVDFFQHTRVLFDDVTMKKGLTTMPFGSWDWPITVASSERAMMELLADIPSKESFHMADVMFEGATTFRPALIMTLLSGCENVKVKRLFLWFAERHGHEWFKRLDVSKVDLGSGKRVIEKGGKLVSKYLITVPAEYIDE